MTRSSTALGTAAAAAAGAVCSAADVLLSMGVADEAAAAAAVAASRSAANCWACGDEEGDVVARVSNGQVHHACIKETLNLSSIL